MLVYKYRGGNSEIFERDLKSIERNQFWSSTLKELNDPCEAITNPKKIHSIFNFIGKKLGMNTKEEFKMLEDNTNDVLSLDKEMGIYSLSKTYLDELLWAHYANAHKGFCIEYDLEILLQNDGENHVHSYPVTYSKNPPEIGILDIAGNSKTKMIQKLGFNKSKRWEHEKEHRIVTSKRGLNSYNHKALKGIYFGLNMANSNKEEMMKRLQGRSIKYYQIMLEKNSYTFKNEKVEDIYGNEITYLNCLPKEISQGNEVKFKIIKSKIFNYSGIGEIEVLLEDVISKEQLTKLAKYLKENILNEGKTIFINYYINQKDKETLPWASTNYQNSKFDIQF